MPFTFRQQIAGLAVVGATVVGGAGAWAYVETPSTTAAPTAASPSASTTDATPSAPTKQHARARRLAQRAVHADVIAKGADGAYATYTIDRGTVTAASATSVTIDRPDGVCRHGRRHPRHQGPPAWRRPTSSSWASRSPSCSQSGTATSILQRAKA